MMVTMLAIVGVLAIPVTAADESQTAASLIGTTLVCVGLGGDGLSLAEWAPEEIADYEARTGTAVWRAHPETGDCTDPAGLTVGIGWSPGWSWLCTVSADGEWLGPWWIAPPYQQGTEVPPSPVTGDCPQPIHYPRPARSELMTAAATAVHLLQLEASGDYARLYAWMHPDSRALVSQPVVAGWFRAQAPGRSPVFVTVERARLVAWKWGVTGGEYPSAAEVTLRVRTADGQEQTETVRLVREHRVWRWFFGRDRDFVDEQVATFG